MKSNQNPSNKKGSRSPSFSTKVEKKASTSPNQKKLPFKSNSQESKDKFFLNEYMRTFIKKNPDGGYSCLLCPGKPSLLKSNVYRHIIETSKHSNAIVQKVDRDGHEELIPLIKEAIAKNKEKYGQKREQKSDESKDYLVFLAFCQKQNISFLQSSALGKFIKQIVETKKLQQFQNSSFDREEISLIAKSYGQCILEALKKDLITGPFSIMIDSSTIGRKNVVTLKIRYLKEHKDPKGMKRTFIENRTVALKYLKESSKAPILLQIVKEKLLALDNEIKNNLVGYVHDHDSNLSGEYEGLGALLKCELPNYFMDIKDPCHSLNLALTKALLDLPDSITGFVDDIHNHFLSPQRIAYLNNIQIENDFAVLCPKHYVKTRWLSLGESLNRLIDIWPSLLKYMQLKPKYVGVKKKKYDEFILLLENNAFKLQIAFLSKIINKINHTNITFQDQGLEIQHLKLAAHMCIKELANIILDSKNIPKDIKSFKSDGWDDMKLYEGKYLATAEFISSMITDIDSNLIENQVQVSSKKRKASALKDEESVLKKTKLNEDSKDKDEYLNQDSIDEDEYLSYFSSEERSHAESEDIDVSLGNNQSESEDQA